MNFQINNLQKVFLISIIFFGIFGLAKGSQAATYWVSPTGAAAWSSCSGNTPLSGTAACSRVTANQNALAGDTVYFRAGTYVIEDDGIVPHHSGSAGNVITFSSYNGEQVIVTGVGASNWQMTICVMVDGYNYIKINGITFQGCRRFGYLRSGSSYNEISNNTFLSVTGYVADVGFFLPGWEGNSPPQWNTHNWIHNNTFSGVQVQDDPCGEAADLFKIGNASDGSRAVDNDNYNTVENNIFTRAGHALMDQFGMYNVFRNNVFHNEPWIPGCTSWIKGTSASSVSVGTNSKTFITATALGLSGGSVVGVYETSNPANAMSGVVTSDLGNTLIVNVTYAIGSTGPFSDWTVSTGDNFSLYENTSYNGLHSHRGIQITDDYGRPRTNILVEGNRLGGGGPNAGNGAAESFQLAAPQNIVRYNYIFGAMGAGLSFKYASGTNNPCTPGVGKGSGGCGGDLNYVYNNTVYHNGHGFDWRAYGNMNMAYDSQGITQQNIAHSGSTGNIIKNNITYDNFGGDICDDSPNPGPCSSDPTDTVVHNYLNANGDPKFINSNVSDPTSTTLPDLTLQSSSPAIDGGTYLTTTTNSGSGSVDLNVANAGYFQDGTWGSDLARGVTFFPDWIAIGTVNNAVQISAINYDTNTITLASPMSWSSSDHVWLYKKSDGVQVLSSSAPDYGAYEYSSGGDTTPPAAPSGLSVQ